MKVFDKVPIKVPSKNVFNLSHDVKASYNFGKLYPFLCQPVYPGDTWNCRAEVFMRTMPLLAPVMHNVDMHFYFFFVPNRIIWNENRKQDWKVFITGGEDGLQNPVLPYWSYSQLTNKEMHRAGSLIDYLGFPSTEDTIHSSRTQKISALPLRAYACVWNEYFRNQNVQNEIEFSYGAGQLSSTDINVLTRLRYKNFEKDYFTSCLPFAQRGEAVRLPITFDASQTATAQAPVKITTGSTPGNANQYGLVANAATANNRTAVGFSQTGISAGAAVELQGTATINSSMFTFAGVNAGTINDFRYCLRLQQWLENNARCGSRYIEQLLSHFGVVSSDARLQRPELLGGGKVPLIFGDVAQTSYGDGSGGNADVVGDLAGKGTLYGKTGGFKKYFEEHGILLGICCILPRTSYQQGLPRVWSAMSRYDFYFPEFAHLGEEAVLNQEVYYNPHDQVQVGDNAPDGVFGYQGRFTELRYIPSTVHGDLRTSLQYWHFGRIFSVQPALNNSFVAVDTRTNMWALQESQDGNDPFVAQIHLDIKAVRPLPKYAVPTL